MSPVTPSFVGRVQTVAEQVLKQPFWKKRIKVISAGGGRAVVRVDILVSITVDAMLFAHKTKTAETLMREQLLDKLESALTTTENLISELESETNVDFRD